MPLLPRVFVPLTLLILAVPAAQGAETIPIRPDEAVLACQARTQHELAKQESAGARPIQRFETERMPEHMWSVKGVHAATLEGEERRLDVSCDVSSNGVEVFTMLVEEMPAGEGGSLGN
ncbi:MAG: hypothetical protein AAF713_06760 [Pseudomonadota bacterium]